MAVVSFNIPDAQLARIADAFAGSYGYTGKDLKGGNENKAQFTKRMLIQHIMAVTSAYESNQAAETARKNAASATATEITVT